MCNGFSLAGPQVVEEYNRREREIQNLEKEFGEQSEALNTYRLNISEVQGQPEMVWPEMLSVATRVRCFTLSHWAPLELLVLTFVGNTIGEACGIDLVCLRTFRYVPG